MLESGTLQPGTKRLSLSLCVRHLLQHPLCYRLVKQQGVWFEVLGDESVVGYDDVLLGNLLRNFEGVC
jgi:hypothetical protein